VPNKVLTRAIASLKKKAAARRARWREACVAEQAKSAQREDLAAFVDRYLKLRDQLARETVEWDAADRSLYIYAVLRRYVARESGDDIRGHASGCEVFRPSR
jgi:hypothetical protein